MRKYKIKHEDKRITIALIVCVALFFLSSMALAVTRVINPTVWGLNLYMTVASLAGMFLSLILWFIDSAVGTLVCVDDEKIVLKRLLGRKTIPMDLIEDLEIDDYYRRRKRHIEYRKKMILYLNNGKEVVLKDNASYVKDLLHFLISERSQLPDEKIPLYNAFKDILAVLNKE